MALSKQLCSKVVATALWRYEEVAPHWDRLILRSWAMIDGQRVLYQEGAVSGLRSPGDLMQRYSNQATLPPGTLMFGGTLGAIGGIRPAARFEMEIEDPVLKRRIGHGYDIEALPVVA